MSRTARACAAAAACAAALVLLGACTSAPSRPPHARLAAADAASAPGAAELAARLDIRQARGRLGPAERQALLQRVAAQGRPDLLKRHLATSAALGDGEMLAGNQTRLLVDGPGAFAAIFGAIEAARRSVLVESYIVDDAAIAQRLARALARKRAQGLQVALLYDAVGSMGTDAAYFEQLRQAGVLVCAFNPLAPARPGAARSPIERDHRKIVAVDGQTAFTGGINISAVYASGSFPAARAARRAPPAAAAAAAAAASNGWRDTHVQVRGPAAARLDGLVRETWAGQSCPGVLHPPPAPADAGADLVQVVPVEGGDEHSRLYTLLLAAFDTAQRSIHVTMAYFAPGAELVDTLVDAARRGVDVQLVLPGHSDFQPVLHAGRARYQRLLDAGVRIHEFQPAVLHAKTVVVDGVWSTVGSSNLDHRSFSANNEINLVVHGEDFGAELEDLFRRDVAASITLSAEGWRQRPLAQRVKEWLALAFERLW